jgi:hypothetical protein
MGGTRNTVEFTQNTAEKGVNILRTGANTTLNAVSSLTASKDHNKRASVNHSNTKQKMAPILSAAARVTALPSR